MNTIEIGERIKRLRKIHRMTRENLAEAAQLSPTFIYEIETGKKSFSAYTLDCLSKALKVGTDYILHGNEKTDLNIEFAATHENDCKDRLYQIQQMLREAYQEIQDLINS